MTGNREFRTENWEGTKNILQGREMKKEFVLV
jgi:hypothetical protein